MRKLMCFILMTVFLMANCVAVYADGIADNQRSDYPGVVDYRDFPISNNPNHKKPNAGFSLQIKNATGNFKTEAIKSGNINGRDSIISSQDSPVINASMGEKITIKDLSNVGSGSKIAQYDIQYRFVPKGSNREDCQIHSQIVNSFNSVKNIIENLKLENEGAYEIYLCVADNASCLPGATNWSANGNIRSINTSNPNFPNGIFWYFTGAVVEVSAGEINLVAVDIKSGASVPVLNKKYTGTVTFKNDSDMPLTGIPIAAYNNGYQATLKDSTGNVVTQTDFLPGETKQFTFLWTLCNYSKLEGVINVDPLPTVCQETNYKDNKVMTVVSAPISGSGNQELTFQAWRQWSFLDVMGHPKELRKPNTAKWTDIVETTLTPTNVKKVKYTVSKGEYVDYKTTIAPPVPTCGDSCGAWNTLTDWEITKATLHYPEQTKGFTFGHPYWDNDWTSKPMKPQGKTAKEKFKQMWALDGAPIFDRVIQEFVGPPKHYTLRADYTIKVTYDETCGYLVCDEDSCWCEYETTRDLTATFNYTGTGKILIDGTGVAPVPCQNVVDFREVYPGLVEVPYPPDNR